jgi:hypothetical protein
LGRGSGFASRFSGVSNEFSGASLCRCGAGAAVECVRAATIIGNRWPFQRSWSAQAQHISLAKLVVRIGVVSRWCMWPTVDMWPGRPVVMSNVVVFYDDIGVFVSVFG